MTIGPYRASAPTGGEDAPPGDVTASGPHRPDMDRRTAVYVDTKPVDLAVERPAKFELHVNVLAAKALALTIPQSILVQADTVIE